MQQLVACSTGKVCAHAGCGFRRKQKVGQWELPAGQTKNNQQLTTASTFHYVGAVALYTYPPECSGGIFNQNVNKCNLTPVFDTSKKYYIPKLGKQQT